MREGYAPRIGQMGRLFRASTKALQAEVTGEGASHKEAGGI